MSAKRFILSAQQNTIVEDKRDGKSSPNKENPPT
jgi:hypothetical protein